MRESWKRKERRIQDRERTRRYDSIQVIGGVGSWRTTSKSSTQFFMVSFPRPLPPDLVHRLLREKFDGENGIEHISTPITPESVSYAFQVKYPMKISDAWNKCVEAFSECLNL